MKCALEFICKNGIEIEHARHFRQTCEKDVISAESSNLVGYIKEAITLDKFEEIVEALQRHPIACDIPIFEPKYATYEM